MWPVAVAEGVAGAMLRALGIEDAELSLVLCDDRYIHGLNREYRGRDQPTDVLAFAMQEGEPMAMPGPLLLGDVVISLPTAARQAAERRLTLRQVSHELLAHGLLHLLGFDHQSPEEERHMRARTDMLMAAALGSQTLDSVIKT